MTSYFSQAIVRRRYNRFVLFLLAPLQKKSYTETSKVYLIRGILKISSLFKVRCYYVCL